MFKFLFVIFFFFILLVFLMGFSILRTFKNIFFGSGSSWKEGLNNAVKTSGYSSDDAQLTASATRRICFAGSPVKKYFCKKMRGSMVDYEEVK